MGVDWKHKTIRACIGLGLGLGMSAMLATGAAAEGLVKYEVVDDGVPQSLTGKPGDAERGRKVIINRKQGNCLACHAISVLASEPFHGEIGPSLDGVAERYSEAQLRLILINAKAVFPDTIMPAFYRNDGFTRVMKKFRGKTILTAQQVEDVLAFLKALK